MFFKGAIYECTYNEDLRFSQSQICMLLDLPSEDQLTQFQKIEILIAPPGLQDVVYDPNKTKNEYITDGWKTEKIGVAPSRIIKIDRNYQAERRQYGLKHHITSTIHVSMGDTLKKVAMEISDQNGSFKLWDMAQVIVACSRTKTGKDTIFVGDKRSTINALVSLIQRKNQWIDYMENVLNLISVNAQTNNRVTMIFNQTISNPYRICDINLPTCCSGFVYFLISCRDATYSYIGTTKCIRKRLNQHNSGFGSRSTNPLHLRPFVIYAYICGFNGNQLLRFHLENEWKRRRDYLIQRNISCRKELAMSVNDVLERMNENNHLNRNDFDLRSLLLFNNDH